MCINFSVRAQATNGRQWQTNFMRSPKSARPVVYLTQSNHLSLVPRSARYVRTITAYARLLSVTFYVDSFQKRLAHCYVSELPLFCPLINSAWESVGGAETAVHSPRYFLSRCAGGEGLIKLDFRNAFNTVSRNAVLEAVHSHFPEIERYVHARYGSKSILFFESYRLSSECGVQQGDPLGPLLFSLALLRISSSATCSFAAWYLDDASIGGTTTQVTNELHKVKRACQELGLELNSAKSEVVSDDTQYCDDMRNLLPECKISSPSKAELLGAPLGPEAATVSLNAKTAALSSARDLLLKIDRHDVLSILRILLGHPKVAYLLRAGSCFDSQGLTGYDAVLRKTAVSCLNVRLEDLSWLQATLPPRDGGLGLSSTSSLALPSYLASHSSTRELSCKLLKCEPSRLLDDRFESALVYWKVNWQRTRAIRCRSHVHLEVAQTAS